MSDLPTIAGGPSDTGANAAASTGITITSNASTHTKATTWTEIITATTYEADWVMVCLTCVTSTLGAFLVDIGVGASTAEQVLIPDLFYQWAGANRMSTLYWLFPLRIPRGTRLSARCQCNTGSSTMGVSIITISSPIGAPPGLARVQACGITSSGATSDVVLADPGATPNTDGTWTEIIASTGFAYKWMCVSMYNRTDLTLAADTNDLLDIGVGANPNETPLINDLWVRGSTLSDNKGMVYCFPCAVAAGTRLTARHRCDVATSGDRRLDVAIYGVG